MFVEFHFFLKGEKVRFDFEIREHSFGNCLHTGHGNLRFVISDKGIVPEVNLPVLLCSTI